MATVFRQPIFHGFILAMSSTPNNVSSGGSEKAQLLPPYPNYVEGPVAHAGFVEAIRQAPRRSFGRRLLTRTVHALLLFTVITMFFPNFMRGVGHFSRSVRPHVYARPKLTV